MEDIAIFGGHCYTWWLCYTLELGLWCPSSWLIHLEELDVVEILLWFCRTLSLTWSLTFGGLGLCGATLGEDLRRLVLAWGFDHIWIVWRLTWRLDSWILRDLSTWELVVTRIDDVAISDDDQMDGWAVAVAVLLSYSSCTLELATLEGWIPQTTLGWNQETQVGSYTKSWCSSYQLVLRKSAKIEIFHITTTYCIECFLSMNILLSFPFTSGVPCLHGWSTLIMHWRLINVVYAT